jgi:eukaryotic-like serine/threonine-protein kinase
MTSGDDRTGSTAAGPDVQFAARTEARAAEVERGACIDRYIVVERIGSGGMGVVYKAFDPELGRPIALKLLRNDADALGTRRDRLVREAQALARLSHPNVIAVHDVGTVGHDVFIAMEFVEGVTLRRWLAERTRTPREVLDVLTAAGDGLHAAHRAGLVHRDFKPDNVILGSDGRVRVIDFGLARATGVDPVASGEPSAQALAADAEDTVDALPGAAERRPREQPAPAAPSSPPSPPSSALALALSLSGPGDSARLLESPLTQAGSILGTPHYMAPEQHKGERVDEKADQFSFCLTLWEALYGRSPYAGKLMPAAVLEGDIADPPDGKAPRWLRPVLRRGLSPDASARHESMAALLALLRADPTVARRRRIGLAVATAALALAAVGWRLQARHQATLCRGAEARLAGVWDEPRRTAVRTAFIASGAPFADSVLRTVESAFDRYARSWSAMQVDACEATKVRHEQSDEVLALRTSCLDERLLSLKTLVDVYTTADAKLVEGAARSAPSLPSFGLCSDVAALRAATPPRDAETRQKIDEVRRQLATVHALGLGARWERALPVARGAVAAAEKLKEPRVHAEAALALAEILDGHADYGDAMRTYHQALVDSVDARYDEGAARAAIGLVDETGVRLSHFEEADRWAALGDAEVRQLAHNDEVVGRYYLTRSMLRRTESRYDDALGDADRALAIQKRVFGPDDYMVAETYFERASLQRFRAQLPEALDGYRRAITIFERVLGPDHPRMASALVGLADVYGEEGDHERAVAEYKRALALLGRVQPEHTTIATIHNDLGSELISLGKVHEGFDEYKRALDLWMKQGLGPTQEQTIAYNNLGEAKLYLDEPEEALRYLAQGNELCARNFGSDHLCGVILRNTGEAQRRLGRLEQARGNFERSLASLQKALGDKHPELAATLLGIGRVALAQSAGANARATLERAQAIAMMQPGDGTELAEVRFALAQALWLDGKRDEGRALATQAQSVLAGAGVTERKQLAEANAWLARHR